MLSSRTMTRGMPQHGRVSSPSVPLDPEPGQGACASGTGDCLVPRVDWDQVGALVAAQQRNREVHTPPISLFRWWARRPHALIGAILEAATDANDALVVSDPFSGGGTVAIEAARRGLVTYAQDLHPWAISGLRCALEEVDPRQLEEAARQVIDGLADERRALYATTCPEHGDGEILTALWVRRVACPSCDGDVFLFPYSYVSRASRAADERWGWWGCVSCGSLTRSSPATAQRRCSACRRRLEPPERALLRGARAQCPHRSCRHEFDALGHPTVWTLALVQRQCIGGVHLDRPTPAETNQAAMAATAIPLALAEAIPDGLETAVLHRAGFRTWADLYSPRQITSLVAAAVQIDALPDRAQIKNRLRLALCGAGEMAGRVSRWDRHYPKAYEAVANHRYAVIGLSAEVNLLADRGRGVLQRRFAASVRAAQWRAEHLPPGLRVSKRASTSTRKPLSGVLLAEGSSARQIAPDGAVDLVLTDPPYFDDVQYAELAAIFLAWARVTGLEGDSIELDLAAEAVANTRRGTDVERYRTLLTAILEETRRTLKPGGRMILTYHNTDLRAWWALGRALRDAQFGIHALAVAQAENDADHSKRGRLAFTRDLVIECRPTPSIGEPVIATDATENSESQELVAAGRAIATMPRDESLAVFRVRYRQLCGPVIAARISPTVRDRKHA
jgi:putative DNA methylase